MVGQASFYLDFRLVLFISIFVWLVFCLSTTVTNCIMDERVHRAAELTRAAATSTGVSAPPSTGGSGFAAQVMSRR